ncbi:hypothetical protein [Massilia genomosp. 1]|uniref:SMI1/KNR4 family protein n=1 Tax=Massilia genomosp. 1 TaxID=2609280 RepID=A0ABX0MUA3_9BURK|nr:hypothetical protein [Massilia genomosp. 1]NHZ66332.1 hypothetical protein [Massilia genomosp. 1]
MTISRCVHQARWGTLFPQWEPAAGVYGRAHGEKPRAMAPRFARFYKPANTRPFGGLVELLDARWCWADYRDSDDFPHAGMATMNAEYVSFGHCEVDENCAYHFFYDRNGDFFVLHFDQAFRDDEANQYMFELASGKNRRAPMTREEFLAPYLEQVL